MYNIHIYIILYIHRYTASLLIKINKKIVNADSQRISLHTVAKASKSAP